MATLSIDIERKMWWFCVVCLVQPVLGLGWGPSRSQMDDIVRLVRDKVGQHDRDMAWEILLCNSSLLPWHGSTLQQLTTSYNTLQHQQVPRGVHRSVLF